MENRINSSASASNSPSLKRNNDINQIENYDDRIMGQATDSNSNHNSTTDQKNPVDLAIENPPLLSLDEKEGINPTPPKSTLTNESLSSASSSEQSASTTTSSSYIVTAPSRNMSVDGGEKINLAQLKESSDEVEFVMVNVPDLSQIDVYSDTIDSNTAQAFIEEKRPLSPIMKSLCTNNKDDNCKICENDEKALMISGYSAADNDMISSIENKPNEMEPCKSWQFDQKFPKSFKNWKIRKYFGGCICAKKICFSSDQKVFTKFASNESNFGGFRYVILLVSVLCMAATRSNDISFNFTFICMTSNSSVNNDGPIEMTPKQTGIIFGGSGMGALIMVLPVVYALHYLGPRIVFTAVLMLSALGTVSLPTLARWSPLWMLPARITQGLAFSAVLPLMGCVSAQWAPIAEISKFMTLLSGASQLAQIVSMPLSAHLCVTSGWSSVYHTHGIISALLAAIFFVTFRRSPRTHPCVNAAELQYITAGVKARSKRDAVPYVKILRTKSVWAVWIAFLGNSFGFQLIIQFMPTFLNKVLGVPITRTGFAVILPPLSQLFVKVVAGWICDRITCISELRKIQMFNSMAMVGCGVFFLPLGFLPLISEQKSMQQLVALLCFTSSISCLGLVSCGSMKSATLIARDFSHFVMAVVQLLVSMGMLTVPAVVNWLAPNNTIEEWRSVFFIVCAILVMSNFFFCRFCSSEMEPWAAVNETKISTFGFATETQLIGGSHNDGTTPLIVNAESCLNTTEKQG